jgi:hypothetical protein
MHNGLLALVLERATTSVAAGVAATTTAGTASATSAVRSSEQPHARERDLRAAVRHVAVHAAEQQLRRSLHTRPHHRRADALLLSELPQLPAWMHDGLFTVVLERSTAVFTSYVAAFTA